MFVFKNIKKYLIIGAITSLILGLTSFGAWKYYTYTQEQIQTYRTNSALAEQAQQSAEATTQELQKNIEQIRTEFEKTQTDFAIASDRVTALEERLSKHDLGFLAQSKPNLVEKIIDKASQDVLRCFEIQSGSPLTQEELNATKPSEINLSCTDIANPNYRP
jgi:predicted negative regulator of RcsB-dependent stress response